MSGEEGPARVDDLAFAAMVRSRIEHEDGLIVSRLAWLMASESFLFTAYAIVLNGITTPGISSGQHHARLIHLIPFVGIASSALIFAGIIAAVCAILWLQRQYRARLADEKGAGLLKLHTPGALVALGLAAPVLLPPVFASVWMYLLATERF